MENSILGKLIVLLKFCNFQSFSVFVQFCNGINCHTIYSEFGVGIRKFMSSIRKRVREKKSKF